VAQLTRKSPEALDALGEKLRAYKLKVGFLQGATYPDGTSVPSVAAWNEFGVPAHNQPPRPFFRNMIAEQSAKWPKMAAVILKGNDNDVAATLDILGQEIQGRIKESITKLTEPALSPVTIARKGHEKPLVDTALMLNSVGYVVEKLE